ncbi:MAG: aspartate kinase [Candidatus Micrarchaeia archaeon]|jgi:aspartate kinase
MVRAVLKFGGGVLRNEDAFERIAGILDTNKNRENIIVVSAYQGITDLLFEAAQKSVAEREFVSDLEAKVLKRHLVAGVDREALEEKLEELRKLLFEVNRFAYLSRENKERITSYGERLSAFALSAYLNAWGIKAVAYEAEEAGIVTDGVLEHAACRMKETRENLKRLEKPLREGNVVVITGYYGMDLKGRVTTFGRGGTDYSAGLVAAGMDADVLEIWKDVDGFMTCDPKLVEGAQRLDEITFREAEELGYFGAKILHPRAMDCLEDAGTEITLKNVLNPGGPGTRIVRKCSAETLPKRGVVTALATKRGIAAIDVEGTNLVEAPGGAAAIFSAVASRGISIDAISTAQVNISFTVNEADADSAVEVLEKMDGGFIGRVSSRKGLALIGIVGENMSGRICETAALAFQALSRIGVEAKMVSKSASDTDLSIIVPEKALKPAVVALHDEFM